MSEPYANCTSVSPECPVDGTIYGYTPNLAANAFFCAFFGLFLAANVLLPFKYKTWTFGIIVCFGAFAETVGYVGRIIMHSNPWNNAGFEMQICCLIIAPSFFAAALYLTLKDMVRAIGPQFSPIKPPLYPWIFISCDLLSLILQGAGGGTAASANTPSTSADGGHIMLAGIVFQVATFTFLYTLLILFIRNLRANHHTMTEAQLSVLHSKNFRVFAWGIFIASAGIYVRCIYRIAELAGGWKNKIMQDEVSFYVLDGAMCCIAVAALTFAYPGIWFKPIVEAPLQEKKLASDSDDGVVRGAQV
ncbi:RTA1-domain-containing protein [Mollisia scopiformis]|uniref:RTA1-domain-containing protein n=1 Tax=Mollisia scopiformis TaxID=149040 RepID=A0A132BA68_MOLSC|nr:RTA1-domain-containing protein [Mollisia scopiformis]KUJ08889.1 RTA1-domain-containing protein [Mollisia scopiformis]